MMKKYLTYILICLALCAIVAGAVYAAHSSAEKKLTQYEEAFAAAEVTMNVTTPTGEIEENEKFFTYDWVYQLFAEKDPVKFYDVSAAEWDDSQALNKLKTEVTPTELSLAEYVKDVKAMISEEINNVSGYTFAGPGRTEHYYAYGITSLECAPLLVSEEECEITWFEGYDESVFAGDGLYCLVPDGKLEKYDNGNGEAVVSFYYSAMRHSYVDGELVKEKIERECPYTMKIVGTYTGGDWNSVYCPLLVVKKASSELEDRPSYHYLSATLADNSRLDEFREKMSLCFLEPSPENEDVPWGYYAQSSNIIFAHQYYPFSLDINDEALCDLPDVTGEVEILESIVKIGVIVLAVTVATIPAGCIVIFLKNKKASKAE